MKFTTALLGLGTFVGVSLAGWVGYIAYDISKWDDCTGYGKADTVQVCNRAGLYQDEVRFFEYETMKTNNVRIRCTTKEWSWDRTGTKPTDRIHTDGQLNAIASDYCDARVATHQ